MKELKIKKRPQMVFIGCILLIAIVVVMSGCKSEKEPIVKDADETEDIADEEKTESKTEDRAEEQAEEDKDTIRPAEDAPDVVRLFYRGYNEHNSDYMKMALLDEAEDIILYVVFGNDEAAMWENHDTSQGSYFNIGVFASYEIEIAAENPVEDLVSVQNSLASDYGFERTVEDACEVQFNRIIHGTERTITKEDNSALAVKIDGYWYMAKYTLS